MSAHVLRRTMQAHALAWGNGYAQIVRDGRGNPRELRLLLPDRTSEEEEDGRLYYRTQGADGSQIRLAEEDVLHIQGLGYDGVRGYSVISLHREGLGLAKAAEEFGARWFGSGSSGGGLLELPGDVSAEARRQIIREWERENSGLANAGKVKTIPAGAKYTALSIPPDDAQFLQTREFQVAEVARMYGVPLQLLDAQGGTTWGTGIEQLLIGFVRHTLGDWIATHEQEYDRKLFLGEDEGRYYTKLNVNALLRGDAKARALYLQIMVLLGVMTREEAREYEDLEPLYGYGLEIPLEPKAQAAPASMREDDDK